MSSTPLLPHNDPSLSLSPSSPSSMNVSETLESLAINPISMVADDDPPPHLQLQQAISALGDIGPDAVGLFGRKACNLGLMLRNGFRVPHGVVIPASSIAKAEADNSLAVLQQQANERIAEMKGLFAVRSSGTIEDSDGMSFAGMHSTFLEVGHSDVFDKLLECYKSADAQCATQYRQHHSSQSDSVSVIIQLMVESLAAGVVFTCNPVTGNDNEIVINAAPGLGEQVVSGKVTPDKIIVDRSSGRIIDKAAHRHNCLSATMIEQLVATALAVEKLFGCAQDIEFVFDGNKELWLTQARPITAVHRPALHQHEAQDVDVYSNAMTVSSFPEPPTPLTWTAFEHTINHGLQQHYHKLKIEYPKSTHRQWFVLKHGRVYQNVSLFFELCVEEFGVHPPEYAGVPPEILPSVESIDVSRLLLGGCHALAVVAKTGRTATEATTITEDTHRWCRGQTSQIAAAVQPIDDTKPPLEMTAAIFNEAIHRLCDVSRVYMQLNISLSVSLAVLRGLVRGAKGETYIPQMLTALGQVNTAERDMMLWKLAEIAHSDPALHVTLQRLKANTPLPWETVFSQVANRDFVEQCKSFLHEHGHRALIDLDIACPRWKDDASYIINMCLSTVEMIKEKGPYRPELLSDDLMERRIQATNKAAAMVSILMRPTFRWLVGKIQSLCRERENMKSAVVDLISTCRDCVQVLGQSLLSQHLIASVDDVFYLKLDELSPLWHIATQELPDLSKHISHRRKQHEIFNMLTFPSVLVGNNVPIQSSATRENNNLFNAVGDGGCPGVFTGRAVVVHSLFPFPSLTKQDVLIAHSTDAVWTPLFWQCSAVAVECGGMLSHAAIVAREFGIVCVLGIDGLMEHVETGDLVTVDGTRGTFQVVSKTDKLKQNKQ